jgi:N-acetylglutamate synthase-like GNAT family acetyltransferase
MPMNAKRMADYIRDYDINLEDSSVSLNEQLQPTGVIMVGYRERRAWITRLGVIPTARRLNVGLHLMQVSIKAAAAQHMQQVQLEVIKGNEPAYQLFRKLGFVVTRDLLVIRRAPAALEADSAPEWLAGMTIGVLSNEEISTVLQRRAPNQAWTEDARSLLNAGGLQGFSATMTDGDSGWLVYKLTPFQVTHIALQPDCSLKMAHLLLYHLHQQHPFQDTQVENLPATDPVWEGFQRLNYLAAFSRIEMVLPLSAG